MRTIYYETKFKDVDFSDLSIRTIFLAGPTPRPHQNHIPSWRKDAIKIFKEMKFDGNVIIPEFEFQENKIDDPEYKKILPKWEYDFLEKSDAILFWVCRTEDLIGLTTNFELGYWIARDRSRVVYGRPENAYKTHYNDFMWLEDSKRYGEKRVVAYTTLRKTIEKSIQVANSD